MKIRIIFLILLFIGSTYSWGFVVIVDPGHGGVEHGAVAKLKKKTITEKELTLRLAQKIKDYLQTFSTVYLTRSFDRDVSLSERAQMAERLKANLFISVHFNSAVDPKSNGFETYYLDNSKDAAVRKVESQENNGLSGDDLAINQILIDLVIQQTVKNSKELSAFIQNELKQDMAHHHLHNRGVKPGLFYVLALSKIPGVLLEVGFMSNPTELELIYQDKFLDDYARSIAKAVKKYIAAKKS